MEIHFTSFHLIFDENDIITFPVNCFIDISLYLLKKKFKTLECVEKLSFVQDFAISTIAITYKDDSEYKIRNYSKTEPCKLYIL